MAKISGPPRAVQYTASAGQTEFSFNFKVYSDAEILVMRFGETLTLTEDYTVTGAGEESGGYITLTSGAEADEVYTLIGNTYIARVTTFTPGGPFAAEDINNEYDKVNDVDKENTTELQGGFHLPYPAPGVDLTIPFPEANKSLKWDPTGTFFIPTVNDPDTQAQAAEVSAAEAEASALSADASAISATASAVAAAISAAEAAASAASIDLPDLESSIIPHEDGVYVLGLNTKRWANIKTAAFRATGEVLIISGGTLKLLGGVSANFKPNIQDTYSLGTSGSRWLTGHIKTLVAANPKCIFEGQAGASSVGGDTWSKRVLDSVILNTVTGASIATNNITNLPIGRYSVSIKALTFGPETSHTKSKFSRWDTSLGAEDDLIFSLGGLSTNRRHPWNAIHFMDGEFEVTDVADYFYVKSQTSTSSTDGYGSGTGVWLRVIITQLRVGAA